MNPTTTTAVQDALSQLASIGRRQGRSHTESWKFGLAWLVGGHMVRQGLLGADTRLSHLVEPANWTRTESAVGHLAHNIIWRKSDTTMNESTINRAMTLVAEFYEKERELPWNVVDAFWQMPNLHREISVIAPAVCDLLFSALRPEPGRSIWLPFDPIGQLLCRALRLGLDAVMMGPGTRDEDIHSLIRQLVPSGPATINSKGANAPDRNRLELRVDYLVACPPLGLRIDSAMGWMRWSEDHDLTETNFLNLSPSRVSKAVEIKRAETWALSSLWPRVSRRATFLVSPSMLFSRGQEQDLRDVLLRHECPLQSVTMLPPRQLADSATQSAVLALSRQNSEDTVLMADATNQTSASAHGPRAPRELDLLRLLKALDLDLPEPLERAESSHYISEPTSINDTLVTMKVPSAHIRSQEGNLTPNRYLKAPLDLPGNRRELDEMVRIVRAPLPTERAAGEHAVEVGIPDLGNWRPIQLETSQDGKQAHSTYIATRKLEDSMLMRDDIVMSIKGTVGKIGFVGEPFAAISGRDSIGSHVPLVASHNCIAIRVRKGGVQPRFLFLYLRSSEFDKQLAALVSGGAAAHIKPADLLRSIRVPVPPLHEQMKALEKLDELCSLEKEAEDLERRMQDLRAQLWGGAHHEQV